jgi:flagellin
MRELAVQAASDTLTHKDRVEIQKEVDALANEITRIGNNTEFNTQTLLAGGFSAKTIHIGANADQKLSVTIGDMRATALRVGGAVANPTLSNYHVSGDMTLSASGTFTGAETTRIRVSVSDTTATLESWNAATESWEATVADIDTGTTQTFAAWNGVQITVAGYGDGEVTEAYLMGTSGGIYVGTQWAANAAITALNTAINAVSSERSKLGAIQNRLEHTIANLSTSAENLTAAESRIRDVDVAVEMMNFTKFQILSQASTAMLAQANAKPQAVLQLLR